jgi:predicted nucleic acid-binding protein
MIVVDSCIWIDNLKSPDDYLLSAIDAIEVLIHPFVIGEIALGSVRNRAQIITSLSSFYRPVFPTDDEVLDVVIKHELGGSGLGWVDAHLLTATLLTVDAVLWTRDKRLRQVAETLGVAANLA